MQDNDFSVKSLGEIQVYDEANQPVKLSSFWKKTTAVLVFVRHFG